MAARARPPFEDPPPSVRARLLGHALSLPEAWEDFPWGETVVKVRKKVFVFLGSDAGPEEHEPPPAGAGVSVKLPISADEALSFPGAAPTGYGLGRAGWVSVTVGGPGGPPVELACDWIEESYRTVAPKSLSAKIPSPSGTMIVRGRLDAAPPPLQGERFSTIVRTAGVHVESIVSSATPDPVEYRQEHDEWVALLGGEATLQIGESSVHLGAGDWVLVPAGVAHRVTSTAIGTRWLAVHFFGSTKG